jgi:5-formyltetrahydrofolate cyclo-ligase
LLVQTTVVRAGVCDDRCLAEEAPCAEHDQWMDRVVTPTVAIHCVPLLEADWRLARPPDRG